MPEELTCEDCGHSFANAIALQQHKMDRHGIGERQPKKAEGPTSHELKEQKRQEAEAARTAQTTAVRGAKKSRSLALYGGAIVGILIVTAYFTLTAPPPEPSGDSILEGLKLPGFNDHWHAPYEIEVCGEEMPDLPASEGGVHSHGDGQVHSHPHENSEVGENANLGLFFDSTNVTFESDRIGLPGEKLWINGDACPATNQTGVLSVLVNGEHIEAKYHRLYVPQDGDRIRVVFGPLEN